MSNLRTHNKRRKRLRERYIAILSAKYPGKPWMRHKRLIAKDGALALDFPGAVLAGEWFQGSVEIRRRA